MLFSDGNKRTLYNTWMDGAKVFEFTIRDVPQTIKHYMEYEKTSPDTYDYFIMHQANKYIHKQLQKRLKIIPDKMPLSLDRYGNTSAAAIPLTLCDAFGTIILKRNIRCYCPVLVWDCPGVLWEQPLVVTIFFL